MRSRCSSARASQKNASRKRSTSRQPERQKIDRRRRPDLSVRRGGEMRVLKASAMAMALAVCTVAAQDKDVKVAGGGITAKGWQGKIDAQAAKGGMTINDSKFMEMGGGFHVTTGP